MQVSSTGKVTAKIGQIGGEPITITGIACTNTSAAPNSIYPVNDIAINNSSAYSFTFQCPVAAGSAARAFTGFLWVIYNQGSKKGLISNVAQFSAEIPPVAIGSQPTSIANSGSPNLTQTSTIESTAPPTTPPSTTTAATSASNSSKTTTTAEECYPLSLSASPSGAGSLYANIENSTGCAQGQYKPGQKFTIIASPFSKNVLSSWSGSFACQNGTGSCSVVMPASYATETAVFSAISATIAFSNGNLIQQGNSDIVTGATNNPNDSVSINYCTGSSCAPSILIASGTGTATYNLAALSAGTYTFSACDYTAGVCSATEVVTIAAPKAGGSINPLGVYPPSTASNTVVQGNIAYIADPGAYNGISPYSYQWLAAPPGSNTFTAAEGNALCAEPQTATCAFVTGSNTVAVGAYTQAAIYDPSNNYMYVLNGGSYNVSVFYGTTVIAGMNIKIFPV
ncbi:MAG: hypothetical protein QXF01_02185, partial [Candidatus Micrarchaeaceae archaeon]